MRTWLWRQTSAKIRWRLGLPEEVSHWKRWLAAGSAAFAGQAFNDYEWRMNPQADLREQVYLLHRIAPFAPPGTEVAILDVGAGPLTGVGKTWEGRTVHLTAVDVLADHYNRLLARAGLIPPIRTQYAEAEHLLKFFPPNHFDLVCCQNALDHMSAPLAALQQMLGVVKPGHAVVLLHTVNVGEKEGYRGLHQWNFCRQAEEFLIWNEAGQVSVTRELAGLAEVEVDDYWDSTLLIVSLIKRQDGERFGG